jgi:hypothetical protein
MESRLTFDVCKDAFFLNRFTVTHRSVYAPLEREDVAVCDTVAEARAELANLLRSYRRDGYPICRLTDGRFQILEPENSVLVPFACGIAGIEDSYTGECFECGSAIPSGHRICEDCAYSVPFDADEMDD